MVGSANIKKLFILFSLATVGFFSFFSSVFLVLDLALLTHIGVIVFGCMIPVEVFIGFSLEADLTSLHLLSAESSSWAKQTRNLSIHHLVKDIIFIFNRFIYPFFIITLITINKEYFFII